MKFFRLARRTETYRRLRRVETVNADIAHLENNLEARCETRGNQIFNHLLLRVDRDGLPSGKIVKVNAMAAPVESQSDAVMGETFALEALADARFDKQIDCALFEEARADTFFDVFPAARFEDDRFDPL